MKADLILCNANIITMDPSSPSAELVAIRGNKIWVVSRNEDLKDLKDNRTVVIDCARRTVLPGFHDAHGHLSAFAESLVTLDVSPAKGVRSISALQAGIRKFSWKLPPGTWVRAGGYNEFYFLEKRHPNRLDLDLAAPHHPVKLTHRSGHAHVLNSLALKICGISKETPDPEGGLIDRDLETGDPTGVLYGMSEFLSQKIPPLESQQLEKGIQLANLELLSSGVTSFEDASASNDLQRWRMFNDWRNRGFLRSRLRMLWGFKGFRESCRNFLLPDGEEEQVPRGGVKIILDETTGRLNPSPTELNEMVFQIHQSGWQVVLHALEERTIEAACSAIFYALQRAPRPDHRHRIEHCAICPPSLARRIASIGIHVVTQPSFIYASGERYLQTVPAEQMKYLYPLATLARRGVTIAAGSDCPIAPVNPLVGIYAASSRLAASGQAVVPEERIEISEALSMYTIHAAKATFTEKIKGSIRPGLLADLVILNGDPTRLSVNEVKDLQVKMTIINGQPVWP